MTKLFCSGYDVEHNVLFGSDCDANDYNMTWVQEWMGRDQGIFRELGLGQEAIDGVYGENLKRFLGLSEVRVEKRLPKPGE